MIPAAIRAAGDEVRQLGGGGFRKKLGCRARDPEKVEMEHGLITESFGAFFAIINPFMIMPLFLSLTSDWQLVEPR